MVCAAVGIDLGGTNIKWCVLDATLVPSTSGSLPTPRNGEESVVEAIAGLVRSVRERFTIEHIGLAIPGHLDRASQQTQLIPNVPGAWSGFPLGAELRTDLGMRVEILNDARALALAEIRMGSAHGLSDVVFASIGTGIGGAIAHAGELLRSGFDSCGEVGHMTYERGGRLCGCGARGCLEAYAGGSALVARARELGYPGDIRPVAVIRGADTDPVLAGIIDEASGAFGEVIASACALMGASSVVVGGGIAAETTRYLDAARRSLADRSRLLGKTTALPAKLGPIAGALGAAIAATEESSRGSAAA